MCTSINGDDRTVPFVLNDQARDASRCLLSLYGLSRSLSGGEIEYIVSELPT